MGEFVETDCWFPQLIGRVLDIHSSSASRPLLGCGADADCMTTRNAATGPLVVTGDPDLRDDVVRLCAAAAVSPEVVRDVALVRRNWLAAACVLVGSDCAADVSALDLPRRADVSLLAHAPATAQLWRDAVAIHADHVVVVPDDESELTGRLTDTVDGVREAATTVGVIGASGGAGASTLSAALALTAARRGDEALLIDVDPFGGGIELVVGCESEPGLRWPDVATTQGRVSAGALRSALPTADGLAVLSWRRSDTVELEPNALMSTIAAAQRGSDVVVLDLPRHLDTRTAAAVQAVGAVLLVCTADVCSVAGAGRLLRSLEGLCGDIRLVVRQRRGSGHVSDSIASSLGFPLAATIPTRRGIERSVDDGIGPLARGGLSSHCSRLLDGLVVRRGAA